MLKTGFKAEKCWAPIVEGMAAPIALYNLPVASSSMTNIPFSSNRPINMANPMLQGMAQLVLCSTCIYQIFTQTANKTKQVAPKNCGQGQPTE